MYGQIESRLAVVHDAAQAFLFLDGSTAAIRAIAEWISTWWDRPLVGVNRIAHKAVVHALDAHGIRRYYLDQPDCDATFDAVAPIRPKRLRAVLRRRRATTHVWVNSVTYEGLIAPMGEIREGHRRARRSEPAGPSRVDRR